MSPRASRLSVLVRGVGLIALTSVAATGCARSEVDICIDRLQNIAGTRQTGDAVRTRCIDAVQENGGKSPF